MRNRRVLLHVQREGGAGCTAVFSELVQKAETRLSSATHLPPPGRTYGTVIPSPLGEAKRPLGLAKQGKKLAFHFLLHPPRFSCRFPPVNQVVT